MKKLILSLLVLVSLQACAQRGEMPITEFNADAVEAGAVLVDVRTPEEFGQGHLPGALNIDWLASDFEAQWGGVDKSTPVYVYCKVGGRSARAATKLKEMGYKRVVNLTGGYDAYSAERDR